MRPCSAPKRPAHKTKLPADFAPGEFSVICGRGRVNSASPGNQHLRSLVHEHMASYSMAKSKTEKSVIVSSIMNRVHNASPTGAFVKYDDQQGDWWEVDESFAREKIGCIFRELLHLQYRSSTKAKQARKKKKKNQALGRESRQVTTTIYRHKPNEIGQIKRPSSPGVPCGEWNSQRQLESTLSVGCLQRSNNAVMPPFLVRNDSLPSSFSFHAGMFLSTPSRQNSQVLAAEQNIRSFPGRQKNTSWPNVPDILYGIDTSAKTPGLAMYPSSRERRNLTSRLPSSVLSALSVAGNRQKTLWSALEGAIDIVDMADWTMEEQELPDDLANVFDED